MRITPLSQYTRAPEVTDIGKSIELPSANNKSGIYVLDNKINVPLNAPKATENGGSKNKFLYETQPFDDYFIPQHSETSKGQQQQQQQQTGGYNQRGNQNNFKTPNMYKRMTLNNYQSTPTVGSKYFIDHTTTVKNNGRSKSSSPIPASKRSPVLNNDNKDRKENTTTDTNNILNDKKPAKNLSLYNVTISPSSSKYKEKDANQYQNQQTRIPTSPSVISRTSSPSNKQIVKRETQPTNLMHIQKYALPNDYWGLPPIAISLIQSRGINSLYLWQYETLSRLMPPIGYDDGLRVALGQSHLVTAPTSAGKSLIADMVALKTLSSCQQKVIYLLPYIALVTEKSTSMRRLLNDTYPVIELHSTIPIPDPIQGPACYICTMEKGDGFIDRLIENHKLSEVGLIVADEAHLVGEGNDRGARLEILLTKLRLLSEGTISIPTKNNGVDNINYEDKRLYPHILAMSATVPNMEEISSWLTASQISTHFRPVPLVIYVADMSRKVVYDSSLRVIYRFSGNDPVLELISGQTMIFCPSRRDCEEVGKRLQRFREIQKKQQLDQAVMIMQQNANSEEAKNNFLSLKTQLEEQMIKRRILLSNVMSPDPLLKNLVLSGVAYHHSGLLTAEREMIEDGFKEHSIDVLCCTTTLAAGVNLPAHRVVILSPVAGRDLLTSGKMIQMAGRAGRAGLDSCGEVVVVLPSRFPSYVRNPPRIGDPAVKWAFQMLSKTQDKVSSSLLNYPEIVASAGIRLGGTEAALAIARGSLYAIQKPVDDLLNLISRCVERFKNEGIIGDSNKLTTLGKAALKARIDPFNAIQLAKRLKTSSESGVALFDEFHIAALCLPAIDITKENEKYRLSHPQGLEPPQWSSILELLSVSSIGRRKAAASLGLTEAYASRRCANGGESKMIFSTLSDAEAERGGWLYWNAEMLTKTLETKDLSSISGQFRTTRGSLQALMKAASSTASTLAIFCKELGWWPFEALCKAYVSRFALGGNSLEDFTVVKGIGEKRARMLMNAGLNSIEDLVRRGLMWLKNHVNFGKYSDRIAEKIYNNARDYLASRSVLEADIF